MTGDGIPDVVLGARQAGPGERGSAYVISGADGSLALPPLLPDETGVDFGLFFVASAGDVDADGTPDIYVGDFSDAALGQETGKVYVFSGAGGARLHTFAGAAAGEGLGPGRGAGDVNGDGHADIVAGAYVSSQGAPSGGRVDVLSGKDGALLRSITSATEGETLGFDAVGLGDVNGDGVVDLLASGATLSHVYVISGAPEGGGGAGGGGAGAGGDGAGGAGSGAGGGGGEDPGGGGAPGAGGSGGEGGSGSDGGGCTAAPGRVGGGAWLALLGALGWAARRGAHPGAGGDRAQRLRTRPEQAWNHTLTWTVPVGSLHRTSLDKLCGSDSGQGSLRSCSRRRRTAACAVRDPPLKTL